MNVIKIYLFILTQIINVSSVSYNGYCGDPGRPVRSQLSPVQLTYKEGETVLYICDDYKSLKQYRQCINGNWVGSPAVCGNSLSDNDMRKAIVINSQNNKTIKEYITTDLSSFAKFPNSFLAERSVQPVRAFGAKNYRIELYLTYKSTFQLVRLSLSVVNHLSDEEIRNTTFNITQLIVSPYRKCFLSRHSSVKPWFYNSTRFDYWFSCESINDENYDKELSDLSDSVIIHTESNGILELDLATFIVAKPYTAKRNPRETLCGTPEVPTGLDTHEILHETKYAMRCAQGFRQMDSILDSNELICGKNMKFVGRLPLCFPKIICDKFVSSDSTEVYSYENVYYHNVSQWYAIEGTKAFFRCKSNFQLFIGKEVRICGKNGIWTESIPYCLETQKNTSNTAIILAVVIIIFAIILTAVSILCYMNYRKRNESNNSNIYDDYELTESSSKKVDPEIYDDINDEGVSGNVSKSSPTPSYTQIVTLCEKTKQNDYNNCFEYKHDLDEQDFDYSYIAMKIN